MTFGSRFPKRPREVEFRASASRLANERLYDSSTPAINLLAYFTIQTALRTHDIRVVMSEQEAEGRTGDPESLLDFARRRLAEYAMHHNEQNDL